jgi:tRNA nucleotidyltransferase/poly(A) polymerase
MIGRPDVNRLGYGTVALVLLPWPLHAQNPGIDALKGKIFDARMAQQTFANGLKYCSELNGKNFYFQPRNRLLNLDDYLHSLDNLVKAQTFNPDKHRPWNAQDAKERGDEATKRAQADKDNCELVQSLPELERQLQELQKNSAASGGKQ